MKTLRFHCAALALILLAGAAQHPLFAQDSDKAASKVDQRITELEKQLEALKSELAALKTPAPAASAPATSNLTATTAAAPAPPPNPLAGISSVLGGANLTGLVDAYYQINPNQPRGRASQFRAFDAPNSQFMLNLIELQLDKPVDKDNLLGYRVALGWGNGINVVNASDPGGLGLAQNLKEGYLSWFAKVGKGLQIDVGKYATPAGAEVIESNLNWNYSRGLLFTYSVPYYHFGARAKYVFNDKNTVMFHVTNGWNNIVDNNSGKTYGASWIWTPTKKFGFTENYMAGPETYNATSQWRQLSDTVITYNPTAKLSLMANIDYDRGDRINTEEGVGPVSDWTGVAGYVKYAPDAKYAFSGRYEYLNDHTGFATGGPNSPTPQHIQEFTATLERKIATHLISRLEVRHDWSNAASFLDGTGSSKNQTTISGGLIFVLEPSGDVK